MKKELGVYLRVPGNDKQKTDFGQFGYHPSDKGNLQRLMENKIKELHDLSI